jgi:hypothetical protein
VDTLTSVSQVTQPLACDDTPESNDDWTDVRGLSHFQNGHLLDTREGPHPHECNPFRASLFHLTRAPDTARFRSTPSKGTP